MCHSSIPRAYFPGKGGGWGNGWMGKGGNGGIGNSSSFKLC